MDLPLLAQETSAERQMFAAAEPERQLSRTGNALIEVSANEAAAAGKSERAIMNQTGHHSLKTVRRYIRQGSVFRENNADGLDL